LLTEVKIGLRFLDFSQVVVLSFARTVVGIERNGGRKMEFL